MVFWVGLRQGVRSASISSLVRQLYQRKSCSELSGTGGVARQLDRITFDPPRPRSEVLPILVCPCLVSGRYRPARRLYSLSSTCVPSSSSLELIHRLVSPRHSLQRIVCWRLRFLMWFLHKPRCATLRLFPHVDVNRDQLLHVFLRAVFPGPRFCELSKVRLGMETVWTLCCPRTRLLVLRTQTSPKYC